MLELNPFDDYPFHQGFHPLHVPATSDSHYNDGYWFGWYDEGHYFFVGMRMHPNNNVLDGYAGVIVGGRQRNARFSRALSPAHGTMAVGPLSVQIVEPMRSQRVTLAPNESGLSFDVTFEHVGQPFLEAPAIQYRYGRLINQVTRYTAVARVRGEATIDGKALPIQDWHGARDHSWGVRSSMGPYVPIGGLAKREADPRSLRFWVPFEVDDHSGFFHGHEDSGGAWMDFEGRIDWKDGRAPTRLVGMEHDIAYHPGTKVPVSGQIVVRDDRGQTYPYTFEVMGPGVHTQGFGYLRGWKDGGAPGVYRGAECFECDAFDVSAPGQVRGPEHVAPERRFGPSEYASKFAGPGGAKGVGMVEHMVYGPHHRYFPSA